VSVPHVDDSPAAISKSRREAPRRREVHSLLGVGDPKGQSRMAKKPRTGKVKKKQRQPASASLPPKAHVADHEAKVIVADEPDEAAAAPPAEPASGTTRVAPPADASPGAAAEPIEAAAPEAPSATAPVVTDADASGAAPSPILDAAAQQPLGLDAAAQQPLGDEVSAIDGASVAAASAPSGTMRAASASAPSVATAATPSPSFPVSTRSASEPPAGRSSAPPRAASSTRMRTAEKSGEKAVSKPAERRGKVAKRESNPDDMSIPPVDLEQTFFESDPHMSLAHPDEEEDPIRAHKMSAAARARRAHLTRYVKGAVAVSVAVCALALVRGIFGRSEEIPSASASTTRSALAPAPAPTAADPAPPASPTAAAPVAPPAPAPDDPAPKTADPPPPEPAPAPAAAPEPARAGAKTAAEEKADARQLLERGKVQASIQAGERSVALDASDGDAWLLLGAAYQEAGKLADARRCFQSCVKDAKHGAIGECRAMLR